ncbi:30S ribosomal protein S8 [Candidatus Ruminimicrobium bovinum]|uniref:30S ribosomal protein S8 n=1 Tax=Candidatus Ruminimicrobium bovinum TaxID=3242779 RepID=UPI0039B8DCAB
MMITDPIADMFVRIRNANSKLHEKVDIPSSKVKTEIAKVLKEEGYISNYKNIEDQKQGVLRVYLKYDANGKAALSGLRRVSKPGLRIYKGYKELPNVLGSFGIAIISTPKGIMASKKAKAEMIGGEVLGYVW